MRYLRVSCIVLLVPALLSAQARPEPVDDWMRLQALHSGNKISVRRTGGLPEAGKFKQFTNASLDFKVGNKDVSVPRGEVEHVILYESKYARNIAKDGAIGAGIGAAAGAATGLAVGGGDRSFIYISRPLAALVLGAAGGLIGFVAGTVFGTAMGPEKKETVIYDKLS
jgi:hypothetical protein